MTEKIEKTMEIKPIRPEELELTEVSPICIFAINSYIKEYYNPSEGEIKFSYDDLRNFCMSFVGVEEIHEEAKLIPGVPEGQVGSHMRNQLRKEWKYIGTTFSKYYWDVSYESTKYTFRKMDI